MKHLPSLSIVLAGTVLFLQGCTTVHDTTAKSHAKPIVAKLVQSGQSWDGAVLPPYPAGQPEVTVLRIEIPPGVRLETHHHPVINVGYLTRGELQVETVGGKTLHLKAGDPIVEVVGTHHFGYNPGKTPAEIVVVYVGQPGSPVTVVESGPH